MVESIDKLQMICCRLFFLSDVFRLLSMRVELKIETEWKRRDRVSLCQEIYCFVDPSQLMAASISAPIHRPQFARCRQTFARRVVIDFFFCSQFLCFSS